MPITAYAEITIPREREAVFRAAAGRAEDLPKLFPGLPPLVPAIVEARIEGGGPQREGAVRELRLSDGSRVKERIVAYEAPSRHAYDMLEMNALQRLLCTNMEADWRFDDQGGATRIRWTYLIHDRSLLLLPVARLMALVFERAMKRSLARVAEAAQAPEGAAR
jgi:hypothetical protein